MIWGAVVGGLVGTLVLTTLLRAASELGLTRMDIPFLLGTAFTADRVREGDLWAPLRLRRRLRPRLLRHLPRHRRKRLLARRALRSRSRRLCRHGARQHPAPGGAPPHGHRLHGRRSAPLLEPPGFLLLNYGRRQTPPRDDRRARRLRRDRRRLRLPRELTPSPHSSRSSKSIRGPVRPAFAVRKSDALVERPRGHVVFARAEVDVGAAPRSLE